MKMNGVDVVAGIAHAQTVAAALSYVEHWRGLVHGEGHVVDGPFVKTFQGGIAFEKKHVDGFIRRRAGVAGLAKSRIIPVKRLRLDPLRLARLGGGFNSNAHSRGEGTC